MAKTGRPSKYNQALENKANEYSLGAWQEAGDVIPSVVGLCRYIQTPRSTIYDWAKRKGNDFSDILAQINEAQELELLNKGLLGKFNSNIAKLVLGKHGYHNKPVEEAETESPPNKIEVVLVDADKRVRAI
ncbi:hypothetical protein A3752_12160 [Oleiphilus sp. HI0081]|nr:hypothetical protein A3749_10785 [Oleiphilus sp. HI0078]KZZ20254.1 hypothetical protein A3752_12160 [Oleiphilus sp. HI0081]